MKNYTFFFWFFLPFISYCQQSDTAVGASSATLHIYYPAEGARGSFKIYMDDSLVWKTHYNSRKVIKIYKEGKTLFWTPPQKQYSVLIDVKFGEEYFLQCGLQKGELILMPVLKQVSAFEGSRASDQIGRDYDTLRFRKERRKLDTVLRRNTFYIEGAGQGLLYSINYERLGKKARNSYSVGLASYTWGFSKYHDIILTFPFSYSFLYGKGPNHFEVGFGLSIYFAKYFAWTCSDDSGGGCGEIYGRRNYMILFCSPKIGYRFQKRSGGLFFKALFSPLVGAIHYEGDSRFNDSKYNMPGAGWHYQEATRLGPVLPWAGISLGYTFNFKKKK